MRIKEEKISKQIYQCWGCNGCVGRWPEEQCPLRFIHKGAVVSLRGLVCALQKVVEGEIPVSEDLARYFYNCTLCSECTEQCVMEIPIIEIGRAFRADLVDAGFGPRPEHRALIEGMKNYDNPWGIPRARKAAWAKKMDVPDISKKGQAEVLYYVGCTAASDPVVQGMARSTASILNKAGVDYAFLGNQEKCCGSTTHWLGDEKAFQKQARENLEMLNSLKVDTVITSCAGCYNMLKIVYPKTVGAMKAEVLHTSEYLARLLKEGKINFTKSFDARATYHDPCHLGKHVGCYDAPREILKAIPGIRFIEMGRIREHSWCCGAGGGVRTAYGDNALKIATERVKEAEGTKADTLVSACPFCYQNIKLSIDSSKSPLKFIDVTELVDRSMEG